jgi:hypothetical protein
MNVKMIAKGTRPLLMHNVQLASPLNSFAKELSRLNKAKPSSRRTDEDRLEIARVEWEGGLYFDAEVGPYFKTVLEAARLGRRGQKIEGGLSVVEMVHPLLYRGPRTIDGLWGNGGDSTFVDFRTVRVGQAKVDRCRPIFNEWAFEADLLVDPAVLDFDELADIADIAGKLKGIGDYRQQFGRFEVNVERA